MASIMRLITAGVIGATIAFGVTAGVSWWPQWFGGSARAPLVGAASTEAGSAQTAADPADVMAPPDHSQVLAARLAALEARLARLSERQSSMLRELEQLLRDGGSAWRAQDSPDQTDREMTPEERQDQAEAEQRERFDVVEETVRAEQVDLDWAPAATQTLHEAFSSEDMVGLELVGADCRTTLCRVDVEIDSSLTQEDTQHRLMRASPWNGYVLFEITGDPPGATFYLARDGERLPAVAIE